MNERDMQRLLTLPDNWHWEELQNDEQQNLRYGWNCPPDAKCLIIMAEGRTEVIEEYFETIRDLNKAGYACAIMDWQGQGMSYRYFNDNSRHHWMDYKHDIRDFEMFVDVLKVNPELQNLPRVLFAHSMGGNLTLHYMNRHPQEFKCAFLVAPMLGLQPRRAVKWTAKPILRLAKVLDRLHDYAPTQGAWKESIAHLTKLKVSSDPIRRDLQPYLFKTRPELRCGGVTLGWLYQALRGIEKLQNKAYCEKITTPIFMALAGKDVVVDNRKAERTASLLPTCTLKTYETAEHQIHREQDFIRDEIMCDFTAFVQKHL